MTKIQLKKQEDHQWTCLSENHTGNQREGCELIDASFFIFLLRIDSKALERQKIKKKIKARGRYFEVLERSLFLGTG